MLQLHVTTLFYLDNSMKIHPRCVRACQPKEAKRRMPSVWEKERGRKREKERERVHAHRGRESTSKHGREREREREHTRSGERENAHFGSSFFMFFLPLGLPYVNWVSQECCLFYLKSSLWSSDLPLTFLCSIFMGFSLPCLLATAILDSCFLF